MYGIVDAQDLSRTPTAVELRRTRKKNTKHIGKLILKTE
jgi:hypothetical protein